jgi:RimJ/RimL family protein N-acetyltransferase
MFPHPYTEDDARHWIAACREQEPPRDLAIEVEGQVAGSCGIQLGQGVSAYTGNIGYWLGERHWNRGIATALVRGLLIYIWETFDVQRLEAEVFAWNPASARVLEKNGFELEGTRRNAIFKDGQVIDERMYVLFRPSVPHP